MDNRTGFRRRGPAYLADEARRALGLPEPRPLADVPAPLVHTALGAAACALVFLLRPGILGQPRSAMGSAAVALATGAALLVYDRLVYPPGRRPPVAGVALPVAALGSFGIVLAGVPQAPVRLLAGLVAALVVGGVPQLLGRRAVGRESVVHRLLRDAAAAAVLAPVLLAGALGELPSLALISLVGAVTLLVTFDALSSDRVATPRAAVIAVLVAAALAWAAHLAGAGAAGLAGARAAALLVLWYGLRGIGSAAAPSEPRPGLSLIAEYAVFVVLAAGALRWVALSP